MSLTQKVACALLRILYSDGGGGSGGTPAAAEAALTELRCAALHDTAVLLPLEPALCPRAAAGRGAWVGGFDR